MSGFTVFPAIDLKDGACVRLLRGDPARATVFCDDPPAQARAFEAAGARWLHVVDLDGAFSGRPVNAGAVARIVAETGLAVQFGGGVRTLAAVEGWLERGVARVVLGTVAAREPALAVEACRRFPGRVALGIDSRDGRVAVQGWAETADIAAGDLARAYEESGAAAIVHTDIARDGAMGGVDAEACAAFAAPLTTPVIASGGVAGLADIEALHRRRGAGIAGAICGRALYDGRLDLADALAVAGPC